MKKLLNYIITSVIGLIVAVLALVVQGTFTQTDQTLVFRDLSNAFLVSGVIIGGVGALVFASNGGAFDMLRFAVIKLFDLFRRDLTKVKYRTFYDYQQAQKEKQRSFAFMLIVGAAFIALAVLFLILYYNVK